MTKPDIEAVRALERFIASQGTPEHLLTFQGILAAHEELYVQMQEKPAPVCTVCEDEIVICVSGDHWHHKDVPAYSHFPTSKSMREFGWTWASEWDEPAGSLQRKPMPQVDWQKWIADLESKIAPVTVWARPLGSLGPWTEVER